MTWNETKTGKLPEPANGWYSLLHLIDHYQVSALANAIEQIGIYVIDQYGRRRQADGDSSDAFGKTTALELLSTVYSEQQNPSEQFSWNAERWDIEDHPLSLFGWEKEHLPDFKSFNSTKNPVADNSSKWRQREFIEFDKEVKIAGSFTAAAKLHRATRQDYTRVYERQKSKASKAESPLAKYKK